MPGSTRAPPRVHVLDIARPVATTDDAHAAVTALVSDGDVVLVKASRSVGLEELALRLAAEATR